MKTISSTFTRYELTPTEQSSGRILNDSQLGVIHNLRTDIAEQKLNLAMDPEKVSSFIQEEAFLKGQLDILTHLIDDSGTAINEARLQASINSNSNSKKEFQS